MPYFQQYPATQKILELQKFQGFFIALNMMAYA
ncbi:hypothetical protein M703_08910 [Neisseria gonorrhoeae SK29344]|nr:hypothetical protein T556_04225 [Neisseria gonorrhoeae NG-k51.05]KLR78515.1 hypothetical protein M679_04650 [Neisseria gonorrhoeae SK7842]KLR79710.1 hypothetical protein M680_01315 [Neisseria gonorrhoeae SK8976]KLR84623.1 hypothetical protein M684_10030 [Neisseria gonorrhoeae SK15454]KLR86787.1 hypothetical protein M677_04080 [Neisseria gonorrhoeae SK6987]KLR92740.1 hypothetical protein M678_02560 [Neisseria gonorrhoeae SK7461]KLR96078.1 hypothetical protein M685_06410 [Neisseria gonorrhoe